MLWFWITQCYRIGFKTIKCFYVLFELSLLCILFKIYLQVHYIENIKYSNDYHGKLRKFKHSKLQGHFPR